MTGPAEWIAVAPVPAIIKREQFDHAQERLAYTQRMARRNAHLFTPANRSQLLARETVLRLAKQPFLAPLIKRLLNR